MKWLKIIAVAAWMILMVWLFFMGIWSSGAKECAAKGGDQYSYLYQECSKVIYFN